MILRPYSHRYKHDAKGQDTVYTYDGAKRVTKLQRYATGKSNAEDLCQQVNYTYDANLSGETFSQNIHGRRAAVQYSMCAANAQAAELYSYHPTGAVTGKRFKMLHGIANGPSATAALDTVYLNNGAGQVYSVALPTYPGRAPLVLTTTYDSMARPISIADSLMTDYGTQTLVKRAQNAQYDLAGRMTDFQMATGSTGVFDYSCGCYGGYTASYVTQTQT